MTKPFDDWIRVFPGIKVPEVVAYVVTTWTWLRNSYSDAVAFDHNEPVLTDNLCEALNDPDRRFQSRMPCDFQPETRELRRNPNGTTSYVARADIRVILGVPGTPHLVIEFKKLDGTTEARRLYCFDGLNRFIEGKYAVGHPFGVVCGFACSEIEDEAMALAEYISKRAARLACLADGSGNVITMPSALAAAIAKFDTSHARAAPARAIEILHVIVPCTRKGTHTATTVPKNT
jgi:hypothetical protein